nr:iron-sulfur cluster assembly accessory protein [Desulfobulbaceae bacterium]
MNITITAKANEMLLKNLDSEKFLRVLITKGGCAGLTYGAEIGNALKEGEKIVYQDGAIRIVSDQESLQYLEGLNVDYSDDLIAGGLKLTNSNSGKTCGCGASFSLAGFPVQASGGCNTAK